MPINGIVWHDFHWRKSCDLLEGKHANHSAAADPIRRGRNEVRSEQRRNARAGDTGNPRENPLTSGNVRHDSLLRKSDPRKKKPPPTSGIIRYNSHLRKSGSDSAENQSPAQPWWRPSSLTTTPPRPLSVKIAACIPARGPGFVEAFTRAKYGSGYRAMSVLRVETTRRMVTEQELALRTRAFQSLGHNFGQKFNFSEWLDLGHRLTWYSAVTSESHVHQSAHPCPKTRGFVKRNCGQALNNRRPRRYVPHSPLFTPLQASGLA
ncbi:hypothetical protein PR048_032262 [Dryococelus australis]|uniref:Uncharacterized protein n=1 Tax=Dryococelus australis TaxID=614101 RepID=A0ABQ9G1R7_9NEOP|nr:hypothetical protein PR048_032262 [Dryococelus australis]